MTENPSKRVVSSRNLEDKGIVYAQSKKGRKILLHEGQKYVVSSTSGDKTVWRCNNASKYGCRGVAILQGTDDFKITKDHNHPRENFPVQVVKMKTEMKTEKKA